MVAPACAGSKRGIGGKAGMKAEPAEQGCVVLTLPKRSGIDGETLTQITVNASSFYRLQLWLLRALQRGKMIVSGIGPTWDGEWEILIKEAPFLKITAQEPRQWTPSLKVLGLTV